jgi:hypothetical protein
MQSRKEVSISLPVVDEDVVINRSIRMLKPIQGPESWEDGRRYLIAPAVLSTCPLQVLSQLHLPMEQDDYTEQSALFGSIELGTATVKYVGPKYHDWSTGNFLLKQNYLMEYESGGSMTGMPRGVALLQFAKCVPHADFNDALVLKFYASPCARADERVVSEKKEGWDTCCALSVF